MWTNPGFLQSIGFAKMIGDFTMFNVRESVDSLATKFRDPLEATGASLSSVQDEVEETIECSISCQQQQLQRNMVQVTCIPRL